MEIGDAAIRRSDNALPVQLGKRLLDLHRLLTRRFHQLR